MKKVFLIIAMILVSVLAKAETLTTNTSDLPVRETIGSVK